MKLPDLHDADRFLRALAEQLPASLDALADENARLRDALGAEIDARDVLERRIAALELAASTPPAPAIVAPAPDPTNTAPVAPGEKA